MARRKSTNTKTKSAAPVQTEPVTPPAEVALKTEEGLRLLVAVTALERDRAVADSLREAFLRLLAELDKDFKLRGLERQLRETQNRVTEKEETLNKLLGELKEKYSIDPVEYSLDEDTLVLKRIEKENTKDE